MNAVFEIMMFAALIGAIDVLYFHIYKFRLYGRQESAAEQVTHLSRAALFLVMTAIVLFSDGSPAARLFLIGIFSLDLLNTVIDVILEKDSRENLGGLPSGEYLLHIVGTFFTGVAVATFWWHSSSAGFSGFEPTTVQWTRGILTLVLGGGLFLLEAGLFASALYRRREAATVSA